MKPSIESTHTYTRDIHTGRLRRVQWQKDKRRCAVAQFNAAWDLRKKTK